MRPSRSWSAQASRVVLVSSACIVPLSTPALAADGYAPSPRPRARLVLPPTPDLQSRWRLSPDSPWAPYDKQTLVAALAAGPLSPLPDTRDTEVVGHAVAAAAAVAAAGLPADTLWIVDLCGAASVAFAATVSQRAREDVAPVLTFNNWPAPNELIPVEETLAALLLWQPSPPRAAVSARPVFILDAWRLAYPGIQVPDEVTDNRYMLGPADLPDVAVLQRQGITRIVYVVESREDQAVEEDDLNATFLEYEAAGIELALVDLDGLLQAPEAEVGWSDGAMPYAELLRWTEWFRRYQYRAMARPTIVSDPMFYARSQGGFGGVAARSSGHGGGG